MELGKKAVAFLVLYALTKATTAQLQQIYTFQKDDTLLKKDYYEQSIQKKNNLLASVSKDNAADYKKIYDEQYQETEDLLKTGRSVTSPEAHGYLQSVLKKIVSANNELNGLEVRVVFSRDWWPNAYSIGEGTIAINAGLMIYLDNEAQLAFVLCHELSHYYLNHNGKSIKKYIETLHSEEFQNELKRLSKEKYRVNEQVEKLVKSLVFDSRLHSRNHESEADLQAFNFLRRTGYDCREIITTLEILDRVDDSSFYKPLIPEQVFDFEGYPFKKKWIQKESAIFSQLDQTDTPVSQREKDSLKTHPDCSKRILALKDSIQRIKAVGKKFQVDVNIFNKLKQNFFIEMTEQCYRADNLSRNLYYNLLMLQANQNVPVAIYSVGRCLNKIYESQRTHKLGLMIDAESKNYSTDYNLLLRMLGRLRLDEITDLNYHFCKRYYEQMKGYSEFKEEMKKIQEQKNQ